MGLKTDLQFWHFRDATQIQQFRQTSELGFIIPLADIFPNRLETKIDTIYVSLVGSTANDPRITCMLEHSGQAFAKRRDGTVIQVTAPARQAPVLATKTAGEFGGLQDPLHISFWGRSPAAGGACLSSRTYYVAVLWTYLGCLIFRSQSPISQSDGRRT
jgi:hypothetical protein